MRKLCVLNTHTHTHIHTHTHSQSEGEPPELEEVNDEFDIPQDSWDILDKAEPITEEPTSSSNPAFITEGPPPPPEDNDKDSQISPPDTSSTDEEIPLITARNEASDSDNGLFSKRSTVNQSSPSSLLMEASPSPSNHHSTCRSVRFKPLIEVVSSSNDSEEVSGPFTKPTHSPIQHSAISDSTLTATRKSPVTSLRHNSRELAWSTISDKTSAAPECRELESGGQWAVNASTAKLKTDESLKTKPGIILYSRDG